MKINLDSNFANKYTLHRWEAILGHKLTNTKNGNASATDKNTASEEEYQPG